MTSASATKVKKQPKAAAVEAAPEPVIVAFKGFDKDFRCRGYQFAEGKTFIHEGKVEACKGGFHACEHPLNVFGYYSPAESRFAVVSLSGETHREDRGDTKIAAAKITITAELMLHSFIGKAVEWLFSKAEKATSNHATGYRSAASATGDQSAASATGDQSAAMACGRKGSVSGKAGNALFLVERDDNWNITAVWAGIAGKDGVEPDVSYTLRDGQPVRD